MTRELKQYVEDIYDMLHKIPEKAFEEIETSRLIASKLKEMGYDVIENVGGKTGIIVTIDSGNPGPILGLRADMDALEFIIDGKKEVRHACGHDAHSSMLLAVAKEIADKGISKGKLVLIFQPAEEKFLGAKSILDTGILDDLEELVGIHIRPIDDTQIGKASPAMWHSSSNVLTLNIKGLSAHGARPHLGINVVDVASSIIAAINAIRINPSVSHSIKVTNVKIVSETYNAIPDELFMAIDMRCETNKDMEEMKNKTIKILDGITQSYNASYEILSSIGVPAAEYNQEMIDIAEEAIFNVLGEEGSIGHLYNPGGEDFHFITQKIKCKSTYIGLGADASPGLHHKDMVLNKEALIYGVDILLYIVNKRLGN